MMLLKRFHDDNESIVALKRFCIYKNRENIRAWTWNGMEQEDFGNIGVWENTGVQKNIGVWKNIGRLQEKSETSECRIGKHWSME